MRQNIKKKKINPLQVIGLLETSILSKSCKKDKDLDSEYDIDAELEKEQNKADKFDALFDKIVNAMANRASMAFFDTTIGHELKTERLGRLLVPFMERGLIKAFKSKQGLKTFLINLEYISDDDE